MNVLDKASSIGQISILKKFFESLFISKDKIGNGLSIDKNGNLTATSSGGSEDVERILISGFTNGTKQFSDDGTVITSTDDLGRTLTKTFTNNFLTCTTVLTNSAGVMIATLVKTFSTDGKDIGSAVTYGDTM